MFETNDSAKVPIPTGLLSEGEHVWEYVRLRLHDIWFYVQFLYTAEENTELSNMLFLHNVDLLLSTRNNRDIVIEDVYLVSPDFMNNEGMWKMEAIKEIWIGEEPEIEDTQYAYVFVLQNNKKYTYSFLETCRDDLKNLRIIFNV